MAFLTLVRPAEGRLDIERSVFLAFAGRADSPEDALTFLGAVARAHPAASHLCWAYRVGGQYRISDGGEPSGTAGQPILRAIEGQGLDHVAVGVIRYFGGIKLGAGGLSRAYGGVAAETLRGAEKRQETPWVTVEVEAPYEWLGVLHHTLGRYAAEKGAERFTEQGVALVARAQLDCLESLERALGEASRGRCVLRVITPGT